MAYSLFVDSSNNLSIGLLDEEYSWLEFKSFPNKKSSGVFHGLIDEILKTHNTDLFNIDRVFYGAGPGSYTGIRLVEGFSQILSWREIKTNSFYHFELPLLLGINTGKWISEAYKGEYFLYSWNGDTSTTKLVRKENINDELSDNDYLVSQGDLKDLKTVVISELIEKNSKNIFEEISKRNLHREPYYYRSIENEFSKPKKDWRKN